jgi:hypothetical protein
MRLHCNRIRTLMVVVAIAGLLAWFCVELYKIENPALRNGALSSISGWLMKLVMIWCVWKIVSGSDDV